MIPKNVEMTGIRICYHRINSLRKYLQSANAKHRLQGFDVTICRKHSPIIEMRVAG